LTFILAGQLTLPDLSVCLGGRAPAQRLKGGPRLTCVLAGQLTLPDLSVCLGGRAPAQRLEGGPRVTLILPVNLRFLICLCV